MQVTHLPRDFLADVAHGHDQLEPGQRSSLPALAQPRGLNRYQLDFQDTFLPQGLLVELMTRLACGTMRLHIMDLEVTLHLLRS